MLKKFLRARAAAARQHPTIPAGQRVYAIGDIHGCDALLADLLDRIDADDRTRGPAATTLVFLGDLVDRGPASAAVIERLYRLAQARPRVRFLAGNHEEIFLGAVEREPKALRLFCRIGGRETALSYGIDAASYDRMDYEEFAAALDAAVPAHHRAFIGGFEDLIAIGDYVFVHAGVRPDLPIAEQRGRDLRWIRDPFLDHGRYLGRMVVHGHTISATVERRPHRVGVDTGAFDTGVLSAIGLEGDALRTIDTRGDGGTN